MRRRSDGQPAAGDAARASRPDVRASSRCVAGVAFLRRLDAWSGLLVGPVRSRHRRRSSAIGRVAPAVPRTSESNLSATDEAILWQLRAPRVVLGAARRRDARARGRRLPGRLPQPARRPVPARRRRRRRPRRDARDRLRRHGRRVVRPAAARRVRSAPRSASPARTCSASSAGGGRSPAALVLAGVTVVAFLTAMQTFVQQQHSQSLQEVYSWILGRLDTRAGTTCCSSRRTSSSARP